MKERSAFLTAYWAILITVIAAKRAGALLQQSANGSGAPNVLRGGSSDDAGWTSNNGIYR